LPHRRVDEMELADWRAVTGVTLDGTVFMTRAVLPVMRAQHDGVIVNIASSAAVQTAPTMGAYAAAKAAVVQLARVVAVENMEHGIRANAILVGSTDTELSQRARLSFKAPPSSPGSPRLGPREASAIAQLGSTVRLQPEGVAGAVLALCADEAREITAATIALDRAVVAGFSHGKMAELLAATMADEASSS
jgi:NAD(P)-dependent dehydrogenase (short-subunit alcohol dehydrogenase family)